MSFKFFRIKSIAEFPVDIVYYLVFGIFCFFIIYRVYDPDILYYSLQPFFIFERSFFDYYQTQHNCSLDLLSNLFLQFLYYPFWGSILLTSLLLSLALIYRKIFIFSENINLRGIELIPSLVILSSIKSYAVGLESLFLFLVTGTLLLCNRLLPSKKFFIKSGFQVLFLTVAFFVFDLLTSFALLLFLIIDEMICSRTPKKYMSIALNILVVFGLSFFLKGSHIAKTIFYSADPSNVRVSLPQYWHIILYHAIMLFVIAAVLKFEWPKSVARRVPKILRDTWVIIIIISLFTGFYKLLFVYEEKYNTKIGYYSSIGEWEKVLDYKNKVTIDDRLSRFQLNRAIFHTDKMSEELFLVSQEWGEHTLFLTMEFNRKCTMHNSDLFFDLGFLKASEYWALETQTNLPYAPMVMERLALCALLLNKHPVANKYLSILQKSIVYHDRASELLVCLKEKKVSELRQELVGNKKIHYDIMYIDSDNPNHNMLQILKEDKYNKMAFEYLMSYYLLRNELGNFEYFLTYKDSIGYKTLPKTYQEALLLVYLSKNTPQEEYKYTITRETRYRFSQFNKTLIEYKLDANMARKDLHKYFGDTYWYYIRYRSPQTTGLRVKKESI